MLRQHLRNIHFAEETGSSGLSGIISGNRDKNLPTIVVSASQTADRRDIPVPLLRFQILLPHLILKDQKNPHYPRLLYPDQPAQWDGAAYESHECAYANHQGYMSQRQE